VAAQLYGRELREQSLRLQWLVIDKSDSFFHGAKLGCSAFKPVVAVWFLPIFDVNPAQFLEISLLIVSPAVAKDECA
jgi:hypothetical protein